MLALPLLPFALKQHVHAHTSEITGELVTPWRATTVRELHAEYANIFRQVALRLRHERLHPRGHQDRRHV